MTPLACMWIFVGGFALGAVCGLAYHAVVGFIESFDPDQF